MINGHHDGQGLLAKAGVRHIYQSVMLLFGTPGILHDEVFLPLLIMGNAYDGHRMTRTLPADGMAVPEGTFRLLQQRVDGEVQ